MTILVLAETGDEHAEHVYAALRQHGHDAICLDGMDFPETLTLDFDPQAEGALYTPEGRRVPFGAIKSVYWRNYFGPGAPHLPDTEQGYIAENDSRSLFESFLLELPARWVNSWQAIRMHQTKPHQLAQIARIGVTIPRTLISNTPAAIREFAAHTPRMIFKPVQGGAHTRRLTAGQITEDMLANLKYAPVTLQEEIEGTNIRAFVAGGKVLACDIPTDAADFRDDLDAVITQHVLPEKMQHACLAIAKCLGLVWTGIDFRLSAGGEYYFLEANPSPMFIGFEERSGLPLTQALLDLLTRERI